MRDPAQPGQALDKANRTRAYRTGLRAQIGAGRDYRESRRLLAHTLLWPIPDEIRTLPVMTLFSWAWRLPGPTAVRLLHAAGASTFVRVGQLTTRQRRMLAMLLDSGPDVLADAELTRQIDLS